MVERNLSDLSATSIDQERTIFMKLRLRTKKIEPEFDGTVGRRHWYRVWPDNDVFVRKHFGFKIALNTGRLYNVIGARHCVVGRDAIDATYIFVVVPKRTTCTAILDATLGDIFRSVGHVNT